MRFRIDNAHYVLRSLGIRQPEKGLGPTAANAARGDAMISNAGFSVVAAILLTNAGHSLAAAAEAGGNSFTVGKLFSDASGDLQFIELDELSGYDGQDQFTALSLSVTNHYGVTKTLAFTRSLPSVTTSHKHVVIVSSALASTLPTSFADYVMPNQFLPTDGGTVDFAGADQWSYRALPTVGASLMRDGGVQDAMMHNFGGDYAYAASGTNTIYEYYNRALDHYFMSGSQPDIDALDTGRIPGWTRTGQVLYAPTIPLKHALPVCRYYLPGGSHFFSASIVECSDVAKRFPDVKLETDNAFYSWLPDTSTGECPIFLKRATATVPLFPVYRLWNRRADSNHRYTLSEQVRAAMIAAGWAAEGYGPMGVALCAPSTPAF
jgi:hypothetical protein